MEPTEYKCYYEECAKTYKTKYNLRRHINSNHLSIKEFMCQVCLKSFASKQNLQGHERTHNQKETMPELEIPYNQSSVGKINFEEFKHFELTKYYRDVKPIFIENMQMTVTKPILPLICEERKSRNNGTKLPVIPILL